MVVVIHYYLSLVGKLGSWEKSQGHFFWLVEILPTIKGKMVNADEAMF